MSTSAKPKQTVCVSPFEPILESRLRTLNDLPDTIRAALRRVVHDYVSGWGIVLTQSPRERRRKKRLWDHRTGERHVFRRPVWVHLAHWAEWLASTESSTERSIIVERRDEMYLVHDLSDSGIGLSSDQPPTARLVVLEFDTWLGKPVEILVQLKWRRQVGCQDYRCGGAILGVLAPE